MRSVGIDLGVFIDKKVLLIRAQRPTFAGLEMHLLEIEKLVNTFKPHVVIMDPITNLVNVGLTADVRSVLTRLIDLLKTRQITTMLTSLVTPGQTQEGTDIGVSSLMDTWIVLKDIEGQRERNRGLVIVKSRGMSHSNQFQEFRLTDKGFFLEEVSPRDTGGLTGARQTKKGGNDRGKR
jgi:circadian clock protein KaiC